VLVKFLEVGGIDLFVDISWKRLNEHGSPLLLEIDELQNENAETPEHKERGNILWPTPVVEQFSQISGYSHLNFRICGRFGENPHQGEPE